MDVTDETNDPSAGVDPAEVATPVAAVDTTEVATPVDAVDTTEEVNTNETSSAGEVDVNFSDYEYLCGYSDESLEKVKTAITVNSINLGNFVLTETSWNAFKVYC